MSETGQPGAATPGEHGDGTGQHDDLARSGGGWASPAAAWSSGGGASGVREPAPRWQSEPPSGWAASSPRHGDLPAPLSGHPDDEPPVARVNGHRVNGHDPAGPAGRQAPVSAPPGTRQMPVSAPPAGRQVPVSAPPGLRAEPRRDTDGDRLLVPLQRPAPRTEQPATPPTTPDEEDPANARHSSDDDLPTSRSSRWAEGGRPASAPPVPGTPPAGTGPDDPPPGYDGAPHGYEAAAPGYDGRSTGYDAPAGGYGAPNAGYDAPAPGYEPSGTGYDAPNAGPGHDGAGPGYDGPGAGRVESAGGEAGSPARSEPPRWGDPGADFPPDLPADRRSGQPGRGGSPERDESPRPGVRRAGPAAGGQHPEATEPSTEPTPVRRSAGPLAEGRPAGSSPADGSAGRAEDDEPNWPGPNWNRPSWSEGWAPPWAREAEEPVSRRARDARTRSDRPDWAPDPDRSHPAGPEAERAYPAGPEAERAYPAADGDRPGADGRPGRAYEHPGAGPYEPAATEAHRPYEQPAEPPRAYEPAATETHRPYEPVPAEAPRPYQPARSEPPRPYDPPRSESEPWSGYPSLASRLRSVETPPERPSWAAGGSPEAPAGSPPTAATDRGPAVDRPVRPFRLRPVPDDPEPLPSRDEDHAPRGEDRRLRDEPARRPAGAGPDLRPVGAEPGPVPGESRPPAGDAAGPSTTETPERAPNSAGPVAAPATSGIGRLDRTLSAPAPASAPPYAARRSAPEPAPAAPPAAEDRTTAILPQRVPAEPDVPVVPEPPVVEPTESPELARIATHLRRDDEPAPPRDRPEGFDVNAILDAVRGVAGVRDASLRRTPAGAHSLRLDLSDGADAAEVSRHVARLLQERMGLAAAPQNVPGMPGTPTGPPPPAVRRRTAEPRSPEGRATARTPDARRPVGRAEAGVAQGGVAQGGVAQGGEPVGLDQPRRRRQTTARGRAGVEESASVSPALGGPATGSPATVGASYSGGQMTTTETAPSRPLDTGGVPGPRVVIDHVQVSTFGLDATVEVRLLAAGASAAGHATGPAVDGYVLRLCAVAAAAAVDELLRGDDRTADRGRCFVEHAAVVPFGNCEVATVVVLLVCDGWVEQLAGSALVSGDPRQAVVRATLAAVNRRLEALLA
ncbi:hypothetical protein [Micromonospora fluostatini]|uniref:hypothetical protein n=1 Tax=Micromonospora sp. JCM 30529 TaxID=3421643 RepID=UPI003D185BAF